MAIARTRTSLRSRIVAAQYGLTTIPAGESGIRPKMVGSFTERYSDTEYASAAVPTPTVREPAIATGRLFVIVSGAAASTVLGASLLALLG